MTATAGPRESTRRVLLAAVELSPAQHLPRAVLGAAGAVARGEPGRVGHTCHRDRHVARIRRPVAELAVLVRAPALDRTVAEDRACVVRGAADRRGARQAAHLDRRLVIGPRAVAELARAVHAPAHDGAVLAQRARVLSAGGDLRDVAEVGDL